MCSERQVGKSKRSEIPKVRNGLISLSWAREVIHEGIIVLEYRKREV